MSGEPPPSDALAERTSTLEIEYCLKPRIDGLALKSKNSEDTLVHAAQWFVSDETLQCFDSESEFAKS